MQSEKEETKMLWLTVYLKTKKQIEGQTECDVSMQEVELWMVILRIMDGVSAR